MLQELFARGLDEMSFFFMGFQKRNAQPTPAYGSIKEYIRHENGDDVHKFLENPGYVPDVSLYGPVKRRRYNLVKFRFESPVYTIHRANRTVYGRLYDRHGEPDAPLAILLHGWRMDTYMIFDRFARIFVREGMNCAMPDLPYHMNRTPGGSFAGEFTFKDNAIHTMETLRQAIFDIMSVINWAREVRGVKRVGIMGVSFGALIAGILACVQPDLDFAVLVAPPVDLGKMFHASRLGRVFEQENPRAERMLRLYRDALANFSLLNLEPQVPKDRIFIAEGLHDTMVPPQLIEDLWAAWNHPWIERYEQGHLSVILFNKLFEKDLRGFIRSLDESPA